MMSRYLLVVVGALACLAGSARPAHAVIVERIVAVVGKDVVLLSEVNERIRPYLRKLLSIKNPTEREKAFHRLQRQELEKLIEEKLLVQEAIRRKVEVTGAEVKRAIQSVLRQNKVGYKELVSALKQQGIGMAKYRARLSRQILRLKVINLAVRSRVTVTDDDVRAFYASQKRRLGVQQKVHVKVIRLAPPPQGPDRASKRAARLALVARLVAELKAHPEQFGALASRYSNHARAAGRGDLGFIDRGRLPPTVDRRIFGTKALGIIGPVEADDGFYIVDVVARQASEALPFAQVKNRLKQQIFVQRVQNQTQKWLRELRKKTYIDIKE